MKLQKIKNDTLLQSLLRDKWLIGFAFGATTLCGALYLMLGYEPMYMSQAKIWIKDVAPANYVVDLEDRESQLKPLTSAGNPVLTQIEVLKSSELKHVLSTYMGKTYPNRYQNEDLSGVLEERLKLKSEPGTDIVTLQMSWDKPQHARELLTTLLAEYERKNLLVNQKRRTYRRQYTEQRLAEIEKRLLDVRERIRAYQLGTLAVDLSQETQQLVQLKSQFLSQHELASSGIHGAQSDAGVIRRQLAMSSRQALNAVALGTENETLSKLQQALNEAEQQYRFDSVKLAPTNPKMQALKSRIEEIRAQIQSHVMQTLGASQPVPLNKTISIFDPVRQKLVENMATSQVKQAGLKAEQGALAQSIRKIDAELAKIPMKKFVLDNLQQEERALSSAYDELRKKEIEARIKEAEVTSNVVIVDPPSMPKHETFPTPVAILFFSMMLGAVSGTGLSLVKTYLKDTCQSSRSIERATGSPILGSIPWQESPHVSQRIHPLYQHAHRNILSNLMIQGGQHHHARVLTFSSTAIQRKRSANLYHLARQLRKLGHSVVLLDADLRMPTLYRDVILTGDHADRDFVRQPVAVPAGGWDSSLLDNVESPKLETHVMEESIDSFGLHDAWLSAVSPSNFSDLIQAIEDQLRHGVSVNEKEALDCLTRDDIGLALLFNTQSVEDPYEYFGYRAYASILYILRKHFDWILINTPAAVVAPEFGFIAKASDGMVLFTEREVTYTQLRRFSTTLKQLQVPLVGSITRDGDWELEQLYQNDIRYPEQALS